MRVYESRREERERRLSSVAWFVLVALIGLVCLGAVRLLTQGEEAEVLGASIERGVATFTVQCEGQGYCTFRAGMDPRTAMNTSYRWDWGDGTSDEGRQFDHYFLGNEDEYRVELTSTNSVTGEVIREHVDCTREEYTLAVTCG